MEKTKHHIEKEKRPSTWVAIAIVGMIFFIFGFVSWLNSILIPYFKTGCELTNVEAYLVAFSFYIAYLFMSVPSSFILRKYGFKKGMMFGFFTMAIGCFFFVPAAFVLDAFLETIDAGIKLLVIVPEHIPVQDVIKIRKYAIE